MKNVFKKFNFLYPSCDLCNQTEKCCKKEMTYEEVIKLYEELSSR